MMNENCVEEVFGGGAESTDSSEELKRISEKANEIKGMKRKRTPRHNNKKKKKIN